MFVFQHIAGIETCHLLFSRRLDKRYILIHISQNLHSCQADCDVRNDANSCNPYTYILILGTQSAVINKRNIFACNQLNRYIIEVDFCYQCLLLEEKVFELLNFLKIQIKIRNYISFRFIFRFIQSKSLHYVTLITFLQGSFKAFMIYVYFMYIYFILNDQYGGYILCSLLIQTDPCVSYANSIFSSQYLS